MARRATKNVRSLAPLPQMEGEPGNRGGGVCGVEKVVFFFGKMCCFGVPEEKHDRSDGDVIEVFLP